MSLWGAGILNGMRITMRNMLRGPITVAYPHQKLELPERARWAVRMKYDEDGAHKCTACLACERACPDYIIKLDVTTAEDKSKHIDAWNYEIGACMMCGLCVEACPFDAIQMSHEYELARTDAALLHERLLEDVDAAKPKRKAVEPKPATQVDPTVSAAPTPEPTPAPTTGEEATR